MKTLPPLLLAFSLLIPAMAQAPKTTEKSPSGAIPVPVDMLVGEWALEGKQDAIRIEQPYPNDPKRRFDLKLHGKQDWNGRFDPTACKASFTRFPEPGEMDDAPDWAKQAVHGKLKWTLELDAGDRELIPYLEGTWYPGEFTWDFERNETGKVVRQSATLAGRGPGRDVLLKKKVGPQGDPGPEEIGEPELYVRLAGKARPLQDYLTDPYSVPYMTQDQPFFVELRLNRQQADREDRIGEIFQAGKGWRNITLVNSRNGKSVTVPASRYDYPHGLTVLTTNDPLTFDKPFEFGSPADLVLEKPVHTVRDLSLRDGDVVSVRWRDARQDFTVFDSFAHLGLAMLEETLLERRALYDALLTENTADWLRRAGADVPAHLKKASETPEAQRTAEQRKALDDYHAQVRGQNDERLQLAKNALKLIQEYRPGETGALALDVPQKDKWTILTRYHVGKRYLELMDSVGDPVRTPNEEARWRKHEPRIHPDYGIVYTRPVELDTISNAVQDGQREFGQKFGRQFLREALQGMVTAGQVLVILPPGPASTGNTLQIIFSGRDLWGNVIDRTERRITTIQTALHVFLTGADLWKKLRTTLPGSMQARKYNPGRAGLRIGGFEPDQLPAANALRRNLGDNESFRRWVGETDWVEPRRSAPMRSLGTPKQLDPTACGPYVVEGVLRDLKVIKETRTLREIWWDAFNAGALLDFGSHRGTNLDGLARMLNKKGIKTVKLSNANLLQIKKYLDSGCT